MPVTDFLERNVKLYGNETALVELNPEMKETRRITWKEYDLIQPTTDEPYRREITWNVFNEKANRFANMLLSRGVKKGDKVAILMYNCLEWLPIYFCILKAGALAVPFNFRYSAEEIQYCADLAEVQVLVFGPEFIGRIESVAEKLSCKLTLAAAKGLHSRITSSAAAKLVRGSLPRRNSGAISRNICMMQARTTEGLMPTITM